MPDPSLFTVGLIQMHCSADPDDNVRRAVEKVRSAAKQGAQMVCLPELFRTQYFCQREDAALFDLAETIPGPTTEALSAVARETKTSVVVSVFERRARSLYHNTAVVLDAELVLQQGAAARKVVVGRHGGEDLLADAKRGARKVRRFARLGQRERERAKRRRRHPAQ